MHTFGILAVLFGAWAASTPAFSGPDEPAHVVRAGAVAGGQLGARSVPGLDPGQTLVDDVPRSLTLGTGIAVCYVFDGRATLWDPTSPPCGPQEFRADRERVEAITTSGNTPPLYYALVGLPLRAVPDGTGLLVARLVGSTACAALIAIAATAARSARRRTFLLTGLGVAVTPMACFLGGVINPSGLEIAAGIATWTLLLVVASQAGRAPTSLVVALTATGTILVLSRALSAAFFVGMVLVTALAFGCGWIDRRDRRWWAAGVTVALALAASATWVLTHDRSSSLVPAADIRPADRISQVTLSLGKSFENLEQMIAWFGWFEARTPRGVHLAWLFAAGLLLLMAVHLTRSVRGRIAVGLLLGAAAVLPVAIEVPGYSTYGLIFQGRYTLPIVAGIPLLCGVLLDGAGDGVRSLLAGSRRTVLGVLWLAHLVAFWFFLRRYTAGVDEAITIPRHPEWSPPLHPWIMFAVVAAASGAWGRWLVRSAEPASIGGAVDPA